MKGRTVLGSLVPYRRRPRRRSVGTVLFSLSFLVLGSTFASAASITGPIVNPANGHTYVLLAPANWTDSRAEAVGLGGDLATVDDDAENAWIVSTFASFGGEPRALWIGMTDAASEGTFVWVSGAPALYTNWAVGEPNDNEGNEDWGQILPPHDFRHPNWNDAPDVVNPFGTTTNGVVEIGTVIPEPGTAILLGLGMAGLTRRRRAQGNRRHSSRR